MSDPTQKPPPQALIYAAEARSPAWKTWLVWLLAAYPVLAVGMIHAVWICEYGVNGTAPIPPHHGAMPSKMSSISVPDWVSSAVFSWHRQPG
jgi:nitrate reductase NapE component